MLTFDSPEAAKAAYDKLPRDMKEGAGAADIGRTSTSNTPFVRFPLRGDRTARDVIKVIETVAPNPDFGRYAMEQLKDAVAKEQSKVHETTEKDMAALAASAKVKMTGVALDASSPPGTQLKKKDMKGPPPVGAGVQKSTEPQR